MAGSLGLTRYMRDFWPYKRSSRDVVVSGELDGTSTVSSDGSRSSGNNGERVTNSRGVE